MFGNPRAWFRVYRFLRSVYREMLEDHPISVGDNVLALNPRYVRVRVN